MSRALPRKWWGWGDAATRLDLARVRTLWTTLIERLKPLAQARLPIPEPEAVPLDGPRLDTGDRRALEAAVGPQGVSQTLGDRLLFAAGRAYTDLVRLRRGCDLRAPDAVIRPPDEAAVGRVLAVAGERRLSLVPFGGGTSVVGGVEPLSGQGSRAVVTLSLEHLSAPPEVEPISRTAFVGAGMMGPALEEALERHGLTLGHFPQSFEFSSVGGWVATRSAGQCSTGFGRIDENVLAVEAQTPIGPIATQPAIAAACGPSLREVLVGSEGLLGVITRVRLRLFARPAHRAAVALFFGRWHDGLEACRRLAQEGPVPTLLRLSDAPETELLLSTVPPPQGLLESLRRRIGMRLLGRHAGHAALMILAFEGPRRDAVARLRSAQRRVRDLVALVAGQGPTRTWFADRFRHPYLRDELLSEGILVETLETAALHHEIGGVYDDVRRALVGTLEAQGAPGLVLTHVSHVYPEGASLYFTVLARALPGEECTQWEALKAAATRALLAARGALSHHHAIGLVHAPYLHHHLGPAGEAALAALKGRLDPAGVLNPGKLLPARDRAP